MGIIVTRRNNAARLSARIYARAEAPDTVQGSIHTAYFRRDRYTLHSSQALSDPVPHRHVARTQDNRRAGESAESVGRGDPAGDTYITTVLYINILHTYLYYMLPILTEKGEQRWEEERRKWDREECERVDEELKRVHKEVEFFVLAKQILY